MKIESEYFEAVIGGEKHFELRGEDRNYQIGDLVQLHEWDGERYTGRESRRIPIRYILRNCEEYGLKEGYCILGL